MKHLLPVLFVALSAGLCPSLAKADPGPPPVRGLQSDSAYAGKILLYDTGYILTSPLRITEGQALFWGGVLATTAVIYYNDQAIADAVRGSRNRSGIKWFHDLGEFIEPVGHMGVMNKYYVGAMAVSYGLGSDKATRIFGEIIEAHFVAGIGKLAVQYVGGRARPRAEQGPRSWGNDTGTSFPSGHTINAFEVATILSHHAQRRWVTISAYTLAVAIGLERVTSDSHWPSDVFFSAAYGTAVARCLVKLHDEYGGPRPVLTGTPSGPALGVAWNF